MVTNMVVCTTLSHENEALAYQVDHSYYVLGYGVVYQQ